MTRILTFSLSLYWAVFFACHATAIVVSLGEGVALGSAFLQAGFPGLLEQTSGSPGLFLGLAGAFALSAALFLWSMMAALALPAERASHLRDISGKAVALGGVSITFVFAVGVSNPSAALFQSSTLCIAGLAGTYAAIAAARLADNELETDRDGATSARVMALNAAHNSLLTRISGRDHREGR